MMDMRVKAGSDENVPRKSNVMMTWARRGV